MKRHHLIVLALAGGLTTAGIGTLAQAQTGDALVHAERTCLDHGITPNSAAFNACVDRAAYAYDRGMPGLAEREASRAADARSNCLRYGLHPHTLGYRQCANEEIDRRTAYMPSPPSARMIVYPNPRVLHY